MPIALIGMIGSLLLQGVEMFGGNNKKLDKITTIASGALAKLPGFIDAITKIFNNDPKKKLTPADFDVLIASIHAEDLEAHQHLLEAQARDAAKK
jgi:hypothetical protein